MPHYGVRMAAFLSGIIGSRVVFSCAATDRYPAESESARGPAERRRVRSPDALYSIKIEKAKLSKSVEDQKEFLRMA